MASSVSRFGSDQVQGIAEEKPHALALVRTVEGASPRWGYHQCAGERGRHQTPEVVKKYCSFVDVRKEVLFEQQQETHSLPTC